MKKRTLRVEVVRTQAAADFAQAAAVLADVLRDVAAEAYMRSRRKGAKP